MTYVNLYKQMTTIGNIQNFTIPQKNVNLFTLLTFSLKNFRQNSINSKPKHCFLKQLNNL